jgi:hypothetical protein
VKDTTILYYTSNAEEPSFEEKVQKALVSVVGGHRKNALPVISVSQKPIDLGTNICVGEHGSCYANEYRQILIGAQVAKTEWLLAAEADCLYPPTYFEFDPPGGTIWRYDNVWILWKNLAYGSAFKKKRNSEGAQLVRREFLIERLQQAFKGLPEWHDPAEDWNVPVYKQHEWQFYGACTSLDAPAVISVKSGRGVRPTTQVQGGAEPQEELPFWGSAARLREDLFS